MKSVDLAYWIGVVQTDGYFKKYFPKNRVKPVYSMVLHVGHCSMPMLVKFREISKRIFIIKGSTYRFNRDNSIAFKFGINKFITLFEELNIDFSDPPKPPKWIVNDSSFFGAYLAGVIDGDGDVRIRRPRYPQCVIRINSGSFAEDLLSSIKSKLNINASISKKFNENIYQGRKISGYGYRLEFCVSSKNFEFFEQYVLDNIALTYKKDKIQNFLNLRKNTKHLNNKIEDKEVLRRL